MFDDQMSDSMRYDTCFAASGAGEDENRAIAMCNGEALRFVQSFEEFSLRGDGFHWDQSNIGSLALSICVSPAWNTCAILKRQGGAPTKRIDCICS